MSKKTEYELNKQQNIMPRAMPATSNAHVESMHKNLAHMHNKMNMDPRYRVPDA